MWRDEAASVTRWPVGVQLHVSPPCMGSVHVGEMEYHLITGAEVHVGLEPRLRAYEFACLVHRLGRWGIALELGWA